MQKANIFNIQHFSVHDGPGIRSVVFFLRDVIFGADGAIIRNLSILKRKYYFILRNVLAAALV